MRIGARGLGRAVGHTFGNAVIRPRSMTVVYASSVPALRRHFAELVGSWLGVSWREGIHKNGVPCVTFPRDVGVALAAIGAPVGAKVRRWKRVPRWVLGDQEAAAGFISAILDDRAVVKDGAAELRFLARADGRRGLRDFVSDLMYLIDATLGVRPSVSMDGVGGDLSVVVAIPLDGADLSSVELVTRKLDRFQRGQNG